MINKLKIFLITLFLSIAALLIPGSNFAQPNLDLPSLNTASDPTFDYREFVNRMDVSISLLKSKPGFNLEDYENSIGEYSRWKWFWSKRISYDPVLEKVNLRRAHELVSRYALFPSSLQRAGALTPICDGSLIYPSTWKTLGPISYPTQFLGFINSVAIDPSNSNILYAGSEHGGLYKSLDGGASWSNKTNSLRIPGIGLTDICVVPINTQIVWATTGSKGYGAGILKSADKGETWIIYPINESTGDPDIPDNFQAARIKSDPTNTNYVWFTKGNSLYRIDDNSQETKLIYTVDPGPNWSKRQLNDLELIPLGTATRILIGTLDPNSLNGGSTIFYSDNNGASGSWNEISPEPNIDRLNMDFSTTTINNFYCLYTKQNGYPLRITEISHDLNLSGAQTSIPPWIVGANSSNDFIEITNLGVSTISSVNLQNLYIERWTSVGRELISDIDPHILNISTGQRLIFAFGSGIDDVTNNFFYLRGGGPADAHSSLDPVGYILKYANADGADVIFDAVAVNGFQFPYASRISPLHWNELSVLDMTGSAGAILSTNDNNTSSCWSISGLIPTTFGSQNPGVNTTLNMAWSAKGTNKYDFITNSWLGFQDNTSQLPTIGTTSMEFKVSTPISGIPIWYCGGIRGYKSSDQGATWTGLNMGHDDMRDFASIPNSNDIIIGNDGGISKTINGGASSVNINGTGLNISEFLTVSRPQNNFNKILGAAMHNYTWEFNNQNWSIFQSGCGDGFNSIYLDENPLISATQCNFSFRQTVNGWTSSHSMWALPMASNVTDDLHQTKMLLYPSNPPSLYVAWHDLYYYSDVNNSSNVNISNFINFSNCLNQNKNHTVVAFDVALSHQPTIYASFNGALFGGQLSSCPVGACGTPNICPFGVFYKTTNSGTDWNDYTPNLPLDANNINIINYLPVTSLVISPTDPNTVWMTFGSFGNDAPGQLFRVIKTTNGGVSWIDYSDGLPNLPANCIIYQKGSNDALYIGTDAGVFYRNKNMNHWECFNHNLPVGIVTDLDINYCKQKITAALFSGGVWESDLATSAVTIITNSNWNTQVTLNNDLIISNNATLTINSDVNIAKGIKITVEPGCTLIVSNAELKNSCGEMWDGVYAKAGSQVTVSGSIIKHAYKAFNFENQSTFSFVNNDFKANFISINLGNTTSRHAVTGDIIENSFDCGSMALPPYFGTIPPAIPPSSISLCGIYAENIDFLAIGRIGTNKNTFSNMAMGIVSYGSNLNVVNAHFENIYRHTSYNNTYIGSAIFSKGNGNYRITVTGNGISPDIENCTHGICIIDQNFTIQNCYIGGVTTGIQIGFCEKKGGYIFSNTIYSLDRGINLFHNTNAKYINVIENEIHVADPNYVNVTITQPGAYGIGIWEQHLASNRVPHIKLSHNRIYVGYGLFGIIMLSADHVIANNNEVALLSDNNDTRYPNERVRGISINDCTDSYFNNNTVNGSNDDRYSTQYGFELNINAGTANYLTCNTANRTLRNFHFGGGMNTTQLFGSNIGNGYEGLHIGTSCWISRHWHPGNCFSGTYGNPDGAAINMNILQSMLSGSAFYVNPGSCYLPTNNHLIGDWFISDDTEPEWDCNTIPCNPCDENVIKDMDEKIALNNFGAITFNEQVKWEGRRYLYEKLTKYPHLMTSNPLYENFYTDYENTNIDKIVHIGFGILSMNQMPFVQALQYDTNDSIIQSDLDSITALNLALNETTDETLQTSFKTQIVFLNNRVRALTTINNDIINVFKLSRESEADIVKNSNSSISTSEEIEDNIKKVNDIYLTTFAKGIFEFSEQQKSILLNIAIQCPYSGGPGVYRARSLYSIVDYQLVYNDIENCAQLGFFKLKSQAIGSTFNNCTVIPNPVKDEAKILYTLPNDEKGTCLIYDNTGKIILNLILKPNSNSSDFNTSLLNSGIYHFQIYSNDASIGNGNFSVIK